MTFDNKASDSRSARGNRLPVAQLVHLPIDGIDSMHNFFSQESFVCHISNFPVKRSARQHFNQYYGSPIFAGGSPLSLQILQEIM